MNAATPCRELVSSEQVEVRTLRISALRASKHWPRCLALMSYPERAKAQAFRFAADHDRYVAARALARTVLSRRLGIAPEAVRLHIGTHGRPFLEAHVRVGRVGDFNWSHGGDAVAFAMVEGGAVGVDVEPLDSAVSEAVARHWFSAQENADIDALPSPDRARRRLDLWMLKESFVKSEGSGLSFPLQHLSFELASAPATSRLFDSHRPPSTALPARLWVFEEPAGHQVAICRLGAGVPSCRLIHTDLFESERLLTSKLRYVASTTTVGEQP